MRNLAISLILLFGFFFKLNAQETREIKIESSSVTNGEANIKGKRIPYKTTAGTMPVWNNDGKPIA
jgi:carboxypeptidase C (cathepsin A)